MIVNIFDGLKVPDKHDVEVERSEIHQAISLIFLVNWICISNDQQICISFLQPDFYLQILKFRSKIEFLSEWNGTFLERFV